MPTLDVNHLKIYSNEETLLNKIRVNSVKNKKAAKKTLKKHLGGGVDDGTGGEMSGGILGDITSRPFSKIYYRKKTLTCRICENSFFFKIDSSLARSVVTNFFSVFAGVYELIKHPMKMFVCANCLTCKLVYPFTVWNRIKTQITEKKQDKKILRNFGYKKYIKSANKDEEDSEDDDDEINYTLKKKEIEEQQREKEKEAKSLIEDRVEEIEKHENKINELKKDNDTVAKKEKHKGGIGLKSHTIVYLKYKHEKLTCSVCSFNIFYKIYMTFKPSKKDTLMYDTIYSLYGVNSLVSVASGSPSSAAGPIIYNKIEEGIVESLSQAVTCYVCAECYNSLMVYPSTLYSQHKHLIRSYTKFVNNIDLKKKEIEKLNDLIKYPDDEPIAESYFTKEKNMLRKMFKMKVKEPPKEIENEEHKYSKIEDPVEAKGGDADFGSYFNNIIKTVNNGTKKFNNTPKNDTKKKKKKTPLNTEISNDYEDEIDRLDLPLKKIHYKTHNFYCEVCNHDEFYIASMSVQRSKTWQILCPRLILFNHPVNIYICNRCFNSIVRYNFSLLDYNPKLN